MRMAVCVLVLGVLVAGAVTAAADGTTKPAAPTETMMRPYREMAERFKFSREQREKLEELVGAKQEALAAYLKENGPAWKEAMEKQSAATDADAKASAKAAIEKVQAGFDDLVAAQEEKIAKLLTPEQRKEWLAHLLNQMAVTALSTVTVGHGPSGEMTANMTKPDAATLEEVRKACQEKTRQLLEASRPFDPRVQKKAAEEIVGKFRAGDGAGDR